MKHLLLTAALGLAVIGCKSSDHDVDMDMQSSSAMHHHHGDMMMQPVNHAIAVLHPTQGNQAHGTVRFSQDGPDTVRVVADLTGLAPNSSHGFHIHEFGDCSAPDATSAGGHFNPTGMPHGAPDAPKHHAGDMGNVTANAQGNVHVEMTLHGITVGSHPNPILGRAVILHAKPDDLKSQPTGDAGSRIACGVIGAAK